MSETVDDAMPERIWAVRSIRPGCVVSFDTPSLDYNNEYVRADIASAAIAAKEAEIERLRAAIGACDWYWPEDDTSSDACADGPWQIVENCDVKPGDVFGYSRGGVIETRYYGFLEAADDAGSDDQFEVDERTREEAEAKISAELKRRAALSKQEGADA